MISETVNIPANTDFSLFQRGAETTPATEKSAVSGVRRDRVCAHH